MTLSSVAARTPDGHTLFDNLSLAFGRERTAIVGRNGVGKTSLLRLVTGDAAPAEGVVSRTGSVGWLEQTCEPGAMETVAETLGASRDLAVVKRVLAGDGSVDDMAEADWTLEDRLAGALADVGLDGLSIDRRTASLSGGEQTRLRLAALMLAAPDLMVLDEPTNHLDEQARDLVAEAVARWPGGVLVVSHDRALLRRMDRIVELSSLGARVHGGGWDSYVERRDTERAAAERDLATAERDVGRISRENQAATEKKERRDRAGRAFRMRGSEPRMLLDHRAQQAEESGARNNRLADRKREDAQAALAEAQERVERVRLLSAPMPSTGLAAGRTVLVMQGVTWRAPDGRLVLDPLDLRLTGPERVAITGANGSGKTTLLHLAAGMLAPTSGRIERPVQAALLDQSASILDPAQTLVENWLRMNPEGTPNIARAALARFLFRNTAADRQVGSLSGGERLRAALACVMTAARPHQLLILDEPTNHLDLDSIAAVEAALSVHDGALIVVSHDRDFLDAIAVGREVGLTGKP